MVVIFLLNNQILIGIFYGWCSWRMRGKEMRQEKAELGRVSVSAFGKLPGKGTLNSNCPNGYKILVFFFKGSSIFAKLYCRTQFMEKWEFCWGEQGTIILTKTKKKLQPLINHMIWLFFWIEQAISDRSLLLACDKLI